MSIQTDRAAQIKAKVSLEDYVRTERKLDMRPEGAFWKALCPFHPDKRPSLQVDPKPGTRWYCHGCGTGGDVIKWVMQADSLTFGEAIERLGVYAGLPPLAISPEERERYEQRVTHHKVLAKVNAAFIAWSQLQAGKNIDVFRRYIEGRGLTLDTARQYKIGYADASVNTVRTALVDAGCTQNEIEESMLLGQPAMFDKRVIVGVKNHDQMRMIYGRSVIPGVEPAHLYQKGTDRVLFNYDRLDKADKVILTESIFDTLALVQMGYEHEAVGALGAKLTEGQLDDLKRSNKKVWILYDNDQTGREKAVDVGVRLGSIAHAIAQLKGRIKDPNEFLQRGGTKLELDKLLEESKSNAALPMMLRAIDPTTPRHELSKLIGPAIDKLAELNDEIQARTILESALSDHFKLKASDIAQYRAELAKLHKRKIRQADAEKKMERSENPELPEDDIEVKELHNGISYVDGDLWYQFLIQKPETIIDKKTNTEKKVKATQVWYVSSNRQFKRRDAMKIDDELVVDMTPVGIRPGRWALSGRTENSIESWRAKTENVNPIATFNEIRGLLKTYLWFNEESYYDLLTVWVFSTYWLPVWSTVGYLFLHASPRSGKTTTMAILEHLAFEAELMGDVSGAALFRKIEGSRGTMLLDEMEKLASEEFAESPDPINQVLLTGYKSSGNTQRIDLDLKTDTNSGAVSFSTYCPKVLANTRGIKVQTIRDRSIELMLLRSDHRLPQFNERRHERSGTFPTLRNQLYTIALKFAPDIVDIYEDRFDAVWEKTVEDRGLFGRDYEVWISMWVVAMWLEEAGIKDLLSKMFEMASDHKSARDSSMAEDSIDAPILKALRRFTNEHRKTIQEFKFNGEDEWYPKDGVIGYLKRYRALHKMRDSSLLEIMKRLHVTQLKAETTSAGGKTISLVKIAQDDVKAAIKRYDIGEDDPLMVDENLEDFTAAGGDETTLAGRFS